MEMHVSPDPVGAPIFLSRCAADAVGCGEGIHQAAGAGAIPLINWSMRNVADDHSHVVMHDLHTCANCHSFSANGKTLGIDMDGPQNDKGLYAMVPVAEEDDDSQRGHGFVGVVPV
jgi:hypothetical protein